jgi:GH24 family phage-related lysozyme (muramidase)
MTPAISPTLSTLISAAMPVVEANEGRRLSVYRDTLGIPTIGIGFNLERADARKVLQELGVDYDALLNGNISLTDNECDYLYRHVAIEVLEWLTSIFPDLATYTVPRQIALFDMGYNLGEKRFTNFRLMIAAVLAGDWHEAAKQALGSKWAKQVWKRALGDARRLNEGEV